MNTEHLSEFERSSSHFTELGGDFFSESLVICLVIGLSMSPVCTLEKIEADARLNPSLLNSNILLILLLGIALTVGLTTFVLPTSFISNEFK